MYAGLKNSRIFLPAVGILCLITMFQAATLIGAGCSGASEDDEVRHITVNSNESPEIPSRIISMSPNLTEIIYALGADDILVGVDEYSVYPPEAADKPAVGNYLDPDLEALIALHPDLVVVVENDERMAEMLAGLGLNYRSFGNDSIREILRSIEVLGELLQRTDEAQDIINKFQSARIEVAENLEGIDPKTVTMVVGRNPGRLQDIYVAGRGTYLSELIEIAGGTNIFSGQDIAWPQVGVEAIIGADPEIIIDSTLAKGASNEEFSALASDWLELETIRAVQDGNIIVPEDGWFQIPGSNLDRILLLIAHWIHPEIFSDVESPYSVSNQAKNGDES